MSLLTALKTGVRGIVEGRLAVADVRVFVCVNALEMVALVGIACAPIPWVRAVLARFRKGVVALAGGGPESRVIWAIDASARVGSGRTTCLARALTAELLLGSTDGPLTMVIGVKPPADGHLKSHAWVERDGRVLVGGDTARQDYIPIVEWNGGAA